jgi:hypothetical protein
MIVAILTSNGKLRTIISGLVTMVATVSIIVGVAYFGGFSPERSGRIAGQWMFLLAAIAMWVHARSTKRNVVR